ncbi:MAG: hypothetical protein IKZ82_02870 [Clostridia bacterium]|nr:hypothetical protein [Clostridia bacterium]
MSIKDFKVNNLEEQKSMDEKLKAFKLEDILSLWYFVVSKNKSVIVGSKD